MNEEQKIRMKQKFADAGEQSALRKTDVMRWVAVAESLPTEDKLYLTYDGTFQVFRYWKGNHFEGEQVATEPKVTYWMEVPEPPFAEAQNPAIGNVLLCEGLSCPECSKAMEQVDTTYSNTKTNRAEVGQHTGDIYFCEHCEQHYIDNLLSGNIEAWSY